MLSFLVCYVATYVCFQNQGKPVNSHVLTSKNSLSAIQIISCINIQRKLIKITCEYCIKISIMYIMSSVNIRINIPPITTSRDTLIWFTNHKYVTLTNDHLYRHLQLLHLQLLHLQLLHL